MNHRDPDSTTSAVVFTDSIRQTFRLQNTISRTVEVRGFGFWTGEDVCVKFCPAAPETGIVFVRTDLPGLPEIPARVEYREEKPRQTSLVRGEARVDMIEHLLATLKGLKIDNCLVRVDRSEMPGFDGSGRVFAEALETTERIQQPAVRKIRLVHRAFQVENDHQCIRVLPNRYGKNSYQYTLVPGKGYDIDEQEFRIDLNPESFREEIVTSRTFLAKHEADYLIEMGLCHRVTPKDVLVLAPQGPIDNEFRFDDECARHKVLDMIGDFALTDCDWIGTFESHRGGHALNAECLRQLLDNTLLLDETFVSRQSEIMALKRQLLEKAA